MDLPFLIILVIAVGALWFMSNRTRKQQREAAEFRNNLVVGDEIMTGSGLFGTVVDVEDDIITIESTPGNRTRWLRAAIAKKVEPTVVDPADTSAVDDAERIARANDTVIDVPDDLSSLPPNRKDDDPDTK